MIQYRFLKESMSLPPFPSPVKPGEVGSIMPAWERQTILKWCQALELAINRLLKKYGGSYIQDWALEKNFFDLSTDNRYYTIQEAIISFEDPEFSTEEFFEELVDISRIPFADIRKHPSKNLKDAYKATAVWLGETHRRPSGAKVDDAVVFGLDVRPTSDFADSDLPISYTIKINIDADWAEWR